MRYMMLIYSQETDSTPEAQRQVSEAHHELMDETARRGLFRAAEPLEPSCTATTVRVHGGKMLVTDGPYAETKEQLAGYYLLDCASMEEAIEYAKKIPQHCAAGGAGGVEVRPIQEFAEIQQMLDTLVAEQTA